MVKLADMTVRTLPLPEKGQKLVYDDSLPAFGVRLSAGGARSFFVQYGRDRRFVTIGRFPVISLAQARTEAKRLLAERTLGRVRPQSVGFPAAVEGFLEEKGKARRARTVADYKRLLGRFGFKGTLAELTHEEMQRRLKRFTAEGEYNHMLVCLRIFFKWAIDRRYIDGDPSRGLSRYSVKTRSRILSEHEIKLIWQVKGSFADYTRLLLLTGMRRGELRRAYLEGIDLVVPAHVSKNHRELRLPTTPLIRSLLRPFPNFAWSREKKRLDKIAGVSEFHLHDCRRTFATNLQKLGIRLEVIEALLNHISGTRAGIVGVYQRYDFSNEMREAIELHEHWLLNNVI